MPLAVFTVGGGSVHITGRAFADPLGAMHAEDDSMKEDDGSIDYMERWATVVCIETESELFML